MAERELQGSHKLFCIKADFSPLPKISQRPLSKIMLQSSCWHAQVHLSPRARGSRKRVCVCVFVSGKERFEEGRSLSAHDNAKESAIRAEANMWRSRSRRVLSASCSALVCSSRVLAACAPEAEGAKQPLIYNQLSAPPAASVFVILYQ